MTIIEQARTGKATLSSLNEQIQNAIRYFSGPKFNWPDDYVRTFEVLSFLRQWQAEVENNLGSLTVPDKKEIKPTDPNYENSEIAPLAEQNELTDVEADAMTLASAGMGTDEDYSHGTLL